MAKEKNAPAEVASLNPDDFLQGGLKDDFRGRVITAVYAPWDYDGNIEDPVLAAQLTIQGLDDDGEEDGDPFVQNWSAGDLSAFVPSEDGRTPADDGEAGPYALRVGKRAQLNNNTNFAHLMQSIIESGEASKGKHFTRENLTASLACLEGLDAHWNRVPQKKRSGLRDAEEGETTKRSRDVLVVTEVYGYGDDKPAAKAKGGKSDAKAGKSAPPAKAAKTSSKPKKEEPEAEEEETEGAGGETNDLDTDLTAMITEALGEADGPIKKGKLVGIVVKAAGKDPRKAKMVKRVTEAEFLENEDAPWTFDEDEGSISL